MAKEEFYREVMQELQLQNVKSKRELNKIKIRLSKKYGLDNIPRDIELLCGSKFLKSSASNVNSVLVTKPTRTISGVAPIAIMAKPFPCPVQARCIFCPGGPGSVFGDTPKSYPGGSPAHRRAERNMYDAYLQVFNRLEHYVLTNHDFSKVELIIMGGTFESYPKVYRDEFIGDALRAMNDFSAEFFSDGELDYKKFSEFFEVESEMTEDRTGRIQGKVLGLKSERALNLEYEQLRNESADVRCVTFCIETRPDCCYEVHIDDILRLGATRVELGVQSIYDDVLRIVERGHGNLENVKATQLLRDSFLKVGYHVMLGLPGSSVEMDKKMMRELFEHPDYKPDALKVYPCMVFNGTKLYDMWKRGDFRAMHEDEAAEAVVELKKHVPKYCRIMRVQRDIPSYLVDDGVKRTNLRQDVQEILRKQGIKCNCIRCREPMSKVVNFEAAKLNVYEYEAAHGQEIFISYDDMENDLLLGFVRLRIPWKPFRKEITNGSAGIREIHVYGRAVGIGEKSELGNVQHKGIGSMLMEEAEKIAREKFDCKKMVVISGIGAREWFMKKFGYKRDGPYVSKELG